MATDRYGNQVSFMDSQPSYKDYTRMRRTQAQQSDRTTGSRDGESRGYEGAEVGVGTRQGLGAAVGLGARAAKFGGMDFGFGVTSAIGATQAGIRGASATDVAKTAGLGVAREALGVIGGPVGMLGKAALGVATAEDPGKKVSKTVGSVLGGILGGPLGSVAGGLVGGAAYGSVKEGVIGDVFGIRSEETARDIAESMGFSRSQTSEMAGVDASRAEHGSYSVDPGISSEFGYGLSPGLSDVSKYGDVSLGDIGFGGSEGGGADSGGLGSDGGGHGARGGGSEGTSEAGGIGGY